MVDIASALGIGSGIDTTTLVKELVSATREPQQQAITSRASTANAKISALASAKSSLSTFSTALSTILNGTGYSGTPTSNDPSIAAVSLITGGVPTGLPAQLEVKALAQARTLYSTSLASDTTAVGLGTLTLANGSVSKTITITSANNTLAGLAKAINASGAGVTASVVIDKDGARLVMKGATGEANKFTLSAGTADADLQRFVYDGTTQNLTLAQDAQDALIEIDNVEMRFSDNTVKTAISYVRIDLNKAAPGTKVTLASDQPTATMRDLVEEFVSAYNTLRTALNKATASGAETTAGALAGDAGVRDMMRRLAGLTSTQLSATGPYKTLADIGVKTQKDGTLALDTVRLDKLLVENPEAVTQMLNPAVASDTNPGIAGALKKLSDTILDKDGSLAGSQRVYESLQKSLAKQQERLDDKMTAYEASLTNTYSKMQSKLTALKATQSYMEQQIAVWSNSK